MSSGVGGDSSSSINRHGTIKTAYRSTIPMGQRSTKIHATARMRLCSSEPSHLTVRSCARNENDCSLSKTNGMQCHARKILADTLGVKQNERTSDVGRPSSNPLTIARPSDCSRPLLPEKMAQCLEMEKMTPTNSTATIRTRGESARRSKWPVIPRPMIQSDGITQPVQSISPMNRKTCSESGAVCGGWSEIHGDAGAMQGQRKWIVDGKAVFTTSPVSCRCRPVNAYEVGIAHLRPFKPCFR
eukprot:1392681-Prymnesium_polylepis.3